MCVICDTDPSGKFGDKGNSYRMYVVDVMVAVSQNRGRGWVFVVDVSVGEGVGSFPE